MDIKKTALVVIDVQKGIAGRPNLQPIEGSEVAKINETLADKLIEHDGLVVLVHVKNYGPEAFNPFKEDLSNREIPTDFSDLMLKQAQQKNRNVIEVVKHNWGAFFGTDLDVQLRRRGIETVIVTGIATSIGVDTTVREAAQSGYQVITVPQAMSDLSLEAHQNAVKHIFPLLSKVLTVDQLLNEID